MRIRTRIKGAPKKAREPKKEVSSGAKDTWPLKVVRSVTAEDVKGAQDHLRTLEVERVALSHAIRHLYQAETDGKINKSERESLASNYKERIAKVKKTISRSRSIVALHELEGVRSDLTKLFNNHLGDLNTKIGKLRSRLKIKTVSTPPPKKKRRKKMKRSKTPKKNEVKERIKKIQADVDKTLERLGQIEIKS